MTEFLFNGPDNATYTIVLAHGAGAPMDSEFMEKTAIGIAGRELRVARFEVPYLVKRRGDGKRRPPDRIGSNENLQVAAELGPKIL